MLQLKGGRGVERGGAPRQFPTYKAPRRTEERGELYQNRARSWDAKIHIKNHVPQSFCRAISDRDERPRITA